ncbi:hypothetical protein QQF64_031109 [Cirrhinus molitorella]|uniref:Fucolectin tachylectin-4 pentraxin-1 domain-containing protein n=1 Tax=Cirrhinus molitorella TaxID=172907 RepID=A0ABR3N5I9_9TELE
MEETDPWWRVDLLKVYKVNRVTITNRHTSEWRIAGAVIRIGNYPDIYSNAICGVISTLAASATATFSCGGMEGRYMIVHIPGDLKILSLCEVGVYGTIADNRAVGGAVTQSSTSGDWFAEKAIDSNRGLQQLYTGCSSTLTETYPWWRLDLHQVYRVSEVVITNRNDCCADQINGAEIHIGNSLENNGNDNPICAVISAIPAGESYSYSCGGMDGRYVNLIIPGKMKMLILCEVEVYGEGPVLKRSFVRMQFTSRADLTDSSIGENILKQLGSSLADRGFSNVTLHWSQPPQQVIQKEKTATQNAALWGKTSESSVWPYTGPEFAIDGLLTTWTHTMEETDPWWRVDLLKVYKVNRVTITNRHTSEWRIAGAVIRIGNYPDIYSNAICGVISTLAASATATFSCGGMEGRYMIVHIPGDLKILSLCEVGVYGTIADNRAVGGAVTQSSTSGDWFAEKAIDSNRGLQQLYTGCSSTLTETYPWWRLDLHQVYRVSEVVITNRNDCCADQINGAEIHIGNSLENNGNDNPICAVISAIPAGESYSYSCGGWMDVT